MAQPVVKNLRFQLSLDDPKLPQDDWVTVRGDRAQLEELCEVVSSYVQHFLEQSPSRLGGLLLVSPVGAIATQSEAVEPYPEYHPTQPGATGIFLQPQGLLAHHLHLGSLATEETGPVARLSTLQLFDLANALDDYTSEIVALPNLQPAGKGWLRPSPAWAQIAAVGLVVAGLSTSVLKLFDNSTHRPEPATLSQGATSRDQKIANQLPPAATEGVTPPVASSKQLPSLPPPGARVSPSPSIPTVTVPPLVPSNPRTISPDGISPSRNQEPTPQIASSSGAAGRDRAETAPQKSAVDLDASGGVPSAPASVQPAPALEPEFNNATARRSASSERMESLRAESAPAASAPTQNSTAFDTIPQVAEVRQYFQQRWSPPEGLSQTIEYTLVINQNGSIQQILPRGQTAGDYVDRTGIPLVGEPFVSPLKTRQSAKIRLVLSPNGNVQTFLE